MEKKFAAFEEDFRKKMEALRAALNDNDDVEACVAAAQKRNFHWE